MHEDTIGADDYRILVYARLIDPEVWPQDEDPEVGPLTAMRLRRSLEAAYRIAEYQGDLVDDSDIVGRLGVALGLDDPAPPLSLPDGIDRDAAAGLVALLMGEPAEPDAGMASADEDGPKEDYPAESAVPIDGEDEPGIVEDDEVTLRNDLQPSDSEDVDPDHDPEAGISHVGDADAGQYHEELRA